MPFNHHGTEVLCSPLFYLIMAPKCKSSGVHDSDMPKRSHKVPPLSEKLSTSTVRFLRETETVYILITFSYCYNCSILLFVIVNFLLCLTYELNFIIGMYVCTGKTEYIYGSVLSVVSGIYWGS